MVLRKKGYAEEYNLTSSSNHSELWKSNISRVRAQMEEQGVDVLVVCDPPNVHYLTGPGPFDTRTMFEASLGTYALLTKEQELPLLFCSPYYVEFYTEAAPWVGSAKPTQDFPDEIRRFSDLRGVVQTSRECPATLFETITKCFGSSPSIIPRPLVSEKARMIKSPLEIRQISRAASVAVSMMKAAVEACVEGARECDIAASAEKQMRLSAGETYPFPTIVSSGLDLGIQAENCGTRKITKNDLVMIDLGASKQCYYDEFTRTVSVQVPKSSYNERMVEAIETSTQAALDVVYPGNRCSEVEKVARKVVEDRGFPYCKHETGHGLGTAVWEAPIVTLDSKEVIEEGMVLAVEPAMYIRGIGGVRIEENLIVTKKGYEVLTQFPRTIRN